MNSSYLLQATRFAFRKLAGLSNEESGPSLSQAPGDLFPMACRHRVAGLLHAARSDASGRDAWWRTASGQAQWAARCEAEAERLHARLNPHLRLLAFVKGPALARQAWPEAGLRAYDDLDVRCDRRDYPVLCRELGAAGYAPVIPDIRRRDHRWHFGWGVEFRHADGFFVEANHRFFPPHYPFPRLRRRLNPAPYAPQRLESRIVIAPTPAFHLLICCLHAVWHGGERLAWVVDLAGLLVRHPGAFAQAEAWAALEPFAHRALHVGGAVAERLFGPGVMAGDLPAGLESAVQRMMDGLEHPGAEPFHGPAELHWLLLDRAGRWRYALRRAFIPGDGDFQQVSLRGSFRFLYWGLRPFLGLTRIRLPRRRAGAS